MNPRILKKLTKKAEPIIIALGLTKGLDRVVSSADGDVETCCIVDRKHRWRGRRGLFHYCFDQFHGTVGYGSIKGYEDPEWCDYCCWSMLKLHVIDSFTDWERFNGDTWPENHCPRKLRRNSAEILKYGRGLVKLCAT